MTKFKTNSIKLTYDGKLLIDTTLSTAQAIVEQASKCKKGMSVEIKQYREKRSLDSNGYAWQLMQKIAEVIHSTKDEVYITMLKRYGTFTHMIVKKEAVERIKLNYKACEEVGDINIKDKTGTQLRLYFGSSTYNTKEMSVLIDGIVGECRELDIETKTPHELQLLKDNWNKE